MRLAAIGLVGALPGVGRAATAAAMRQDAAVSSMEVSWSTSVILVLVVILARLAVEEVGIRRQVEELAVGHVFEALESLV